MRAVWAIRLGAVGVLAAATLAASRIGAADPGASESVAAPPTTAAGPTTTFRLNPLTPTDPNRIPPDQRTAIERLGRAASTLSPADGSGHSHAPGTTVALAPADQTLLDAQLAQARAVAATLPRPQDAEAAGYFPASVPGVGVGTHYVKWSLIDQPFDPTKPSMLLYDIRNGHKEQLVGLSYWIRSDGPPEGFAGPNDVWHQHSGLCVVNGWIDREQAPPPPDGCPGTWLAGGDLWMLHVWVVPGWDNRQGVFANINRKLCPTAAGTPDVSRCEFFEFGD